MSRHITARFALALAFFGLGQIDSYRLQALEPATTSDSLANHQPAVSGELHVYGNSAGEQSYAIAMRAADLPQATSAQVVVLVDTSASQTGTYWEDTLAAVKSLGDGLRPSDRVALVALDVQAEVMTEGLVAPQSDAWKQGFQRLQGRSPLGATDLLAGLRAVLAQPWAKEATQSRSVIYVGDGTSRADIISEQDLRNVTADFVKARISMHSYALGRQTDVAFVAVLANHTGGNVFLDGPNVTATQAGLELARVAQTAVLWPVTAEFPKGLHTRFPSDLPPLRSDRETILVGKLSAATGEFLSIQMTGECLGKSKIWKWEAKVRESEEGFAYLPRLLEMVSRSQGFQFPVLGLRGLQIVQESLLTEASDFGDLAKQAAAEGDFEAAERLAAAALKRDPSNLRAQSVVRSVRRAATEVKPAIQATAEIAPAPTKTAPAATKSNTKSRQTDQGKKKGQVKKPREGGASFASPIRWKKVQFTAKQDPDFGGDVIGEQLTAPGGEPISEGSVTRPADPDAGRLVDDSVARARLQSDILTAEVKNAVKTAREQMRSNPEGVLQELKFELDAVRQAIDVTEGVRTRLADELRRAIQETEHRKVEKDEQDRRLNETQAIGLERLNLLEAAQQQEERVANLVAQFNRLTDEGDYPRATEVAEASHKLAPGDPTTIAANEVSQFKMNIERAMDMRERRHRAYHHIMDSVEEAAIPFVGDPPIVYPDAETWHALTKRRAKWKKSVDLARLGPAEQRIFDRFDDPTDMNYTDTPFSQVVADLENQHGIEIEIDTRALEALGLSAESMQINRQLNGVSLRSALRLLLNDLDLTYLVRDEVLFITTPEEAQSKLVTKVYPVADVVIPIQSGGGGMGGGMGMMGGMGGGMGMMGGMGGGMGGMGGMGMGGMGGGMGGMGMGGMGGMGGGMGGMGGFFAVQDAISLSDQLPGSPTSETPVTNDTPARSAKPSVLKAERSNNESLSAAWDRIFAQEVAPGDVRVTVQSLLQEKNYEEAVAVIHAALRHRQPQSWMYKALEIALRAQNASAADLERALLSGIDLAENLDQILEIAVYMSQLGLERRALVVLRDLAEINPTQPEPYVYALAAAKRIDDVESLKWACLHIAEQSWSEGERSFAEKAGRTARAIVDGLQKSGDTVAAEAFTQELQRALTRDIVAVVKWTGDADVDILVKEPSGTICSYQDRRTTSGGCLLGDSYSVKKKESVDGISEVYECGQGYSGLYQLCIRRIWGKVAAGKVTVDVYLHYGTPEQRRIRQVVPLGDKDTMVTFELADGRREQPLEEHQVAEAAQRQSVRLNQSVLAQQISSLADNNTVRDFVAARAGLIDPRLLAGRLGGAVGYMPVITQLPEGLSLTASAVVSADRRYVRVTPRPFSSDIREVVRFNFVTGGQQTDGGATGGTGGTGGAAGGFGGGGFGGGGGF